MNAAAATPPRFVRRTTLNEGEYRVNFKQIDCDVLAALVSAAASKVTPLMSKIYLSLLLAPPSCWEREGVLRFAGECREGGKGNREVLTAWEQLCELTGVSNSTLAKALDWLRETGLIGYYAGKNGVGIRIFFNRAAASIRRRPEAQKNLRLVPAPSDAAPAPTNGAPFKELGSEKDLEQGDPRAHARELPSTLTRTTAAPAPAPAVAPPPTPGGAAASPALPGPAPTAAPAAAAVSIPPAATSAVVVRQVLSELGPELNAAVQRESAALKNWFLNQAVPKAVRVAQREAYDVLRAYGVLNKAGNQSAYVGSNNAPPSAGGAENAPSSASGAENSPHAEVAAFLAETSTSVQRFAAHCPLVTARVRLTCEAVVGELDELRVQTTAGQLPMPDELETRLQTLDGGLTEALWLALEAAERETLLQTSRSELKQYAERMEPEIFAQTVRKRAVAKLRERYKLPHLSLFYR
jgi:hypothetical protein